MVCNIPWIPGSGILWGKGVLGRREGQKEKGRGRNRRGKQGRREGGRRETETDRLTSLVSMESKTFPVNK